jgi:putative effector of murein hydrolase
MNAAVAVLGTVAVYVLADAVADRLGRPAWATPSLWAAVALLGVLSLFGVSTDDYGERTDVLRWLLGPATVALGVPLARAVRSLEGRAAGLRIVAAVLAGGFVTSLSAGVVASVLGGSDEVVAAASAKSVSAPIAVAIELPIGVDDGLMAATCVVAGLFGAVFLPLLGRRLRLDDDRALGTGVGVTAHAIGSAELRRHAPGAVGWAAAGLALNGVLTALWLPALMSLASFPS